MSNTPFAVQNEARESLAEKLAESQPKRLWPYVVASALVMTAAFPPLDLGFLAWIGLAPLLYALSRAHRPRRAFALGYLFGYLHWGLTVTWIGTTVVAWSGTPLGWIAWVILVAVKSLWFGLFGFLAWWLNRKSAGTLRLLGLAATWTIVEWLRGQSALAMPWSLVGYSQYAYLPLIQAADIGGVYLISFAVVLFNAGARAAISDRDPELNRSTAVLRALREMAVPAGVLAAMLAYGGFRLTQQFVGDSIQLALMQPNERSSRYGSTSETSALGKYRWMAGSAKGADVLVWPESTAEHVVEEPESRGTFSEIARNTAAYQVVGTGYADQTGASHNSAALFSPSGRLEGRYDKHWLVPFGEWVPLRAYIPFGEVFGLPQHDVIPGSSDSLLEAGKARMSVLICYESVFPTLSRVRSAKGANLLVSITNDSWAGESAELRQHFAMTLFRAVETRRYVASSATTGITALIDPAGRAREISPYKPGVLQSEARLCEGNSPYVRWGDGFVAACLVLVAGALGGFTRKNTEIGS